MARHRMSSVDTAWLRMDSPTNLMMIVGVMIFERPIDLRRLATLIEGRLLVYPRFRQYVVDDGVAAWWVDDEQFDLESHLLTVRLPGAGGERELQDFVGRLAAEPLAPGKPLWQFHVIEDYQGGSALVARIHHCIADGIALIGVLLNLTDTDPNAPDTPRVLPKTARPKTRRLAALATMAEEGVERVFRDLGQFGPLGAQVQSLLAQAVPALTALSPLADTAARMASPLTGPLTSTVESALDQGLRMGSAMVTKYSRWVDDPTEAADAARMAMGVAQELAYLATMPTDTPTRLKGRVGKVKRVAWSAPISLTRVKDVGYVLGCSVNDVLLASVAGAIRSYLTDRGDRVPPDALLRAFVPVNLRARDKIHQLGNHFGLVGLELPIGVANPIERVFEVRRRMNGLKNGYQAVVSMALLGVLGYVPRAIQRQALALLSDKGTAVMTNVPGPTEPLYLAGSRIAQTMFWVPQSGNVGVGVSILSYAGGVQFGLMTDRRLCPDPDAIIRRFEPEFEKLVTSLMWLERGQVGADAAAFDALLSADDALVTETLGPPPVKPKARRKARAPSSPAAAQGNTTAA